MDQAAPTSHGGSAQAGWLGAKGVALAADGFPAGHMVATQVGPARTVTFAPSAASDDANQGAARGVGHLVLGHGAGGGTWSADLVLLTSLVDAGWRVTLVEQPWRVAGRRVAARPEVLDRAWVNVLTAVRERDGDRRPLVVGGRSAGARVACRTVEAVLPDAVLALAFPLHPPGRPERSRADELRHILDRGVPLLVVNGQRDPFGGPGEIEAVVGDRATVVEVAGAHAFARDPLDVLHACRTWLARRPWE